MKKTLYIFYQQDIIVECELTVQKSTLAVNYKKYEKEMRGKAQESGGRNEERN